MKNLKHYAIAVVAAVLFSACGTTRTVPLTGRKQNLMISDQEVLSLSSQEYTKYMQGAKKSADATNTAMVQRVGQKLANAVQNYLTNNGYANELQNYAWEFNLVQDKNVNAFCMPGGKIVVYEGLLPVTQNEASLAIVLGHEIAHAVANHSAEQMSKQIKQQYGLQIGSAVAGALGMGTNTQSIAQVIAQYGLQFRNLKYSRDHETPDEVPARGSEVLQAACADNHDDHSQEGFIDKVDRNSQGFYDKEVNDEEALTPASGIRQKS